MTSVRAGIVDVLFRGDFGGLNTGLTEMDGKLAGVGGAMQGVERTSMTTERGVGRLGFALTNMGAAGGVTSAGLQGVEFGLMRMLPGLSYGLVAAIALGEGMELLGRKAEEQEKKAEDAAKAYDEFLAHLKIKGPEEREDVRQVEATRGLEGARQRVTTITAALAIAQRSLADADAEAVKNGQFVLATLLKQVAAEAEVKVWTEALTQAQTEASARGTVVNQNTQALTAQFDAEKDKLDEVIIRYTRGARAAELFALGLKGYSDAQKAAIHSEAERGRFDETVSGLEDEIMKLRLTADAYAVYEARKKDAAEGPGQERTIRELAQILDITRELSTLKMPNEEEAEATDRANVIRNRNAAIIQGQEEETAAWVERTERAHAEAAKLGAIGVQAGHSFIEGLILGTGRLEDLLKQTFAHIVSSQIMGAISKSFEYHVPGAEAEPSEAGGIDWSSALAHSFGARMSFSAGASTAPRAPRFGASTVSMAGAGIGPSIVHQHSWNVRADDPGTFVERLQSYRGLFTQMHLQDLNESDAARQGVRAAIP